DQPGRRPVPAIDDRQMAGTPRRVAPDRPTMLTVRASAKGDTAVDQALAHLVSLQHANGCWEGEMVWCTMILSQYVIVKHITGCSWDEATRGRILRHYQVTRRPDGSWGLHPESDGYVFTTALAYVALRLLGLGPEDELPASARRWLHAQPGGVLAA